MVEARPLHRQKHRATPLPADPDTLNKAQHSKDDRTPDADLRISRHKGYEERRDTHQQQGCDQRSLSPDAVAVVTENCSAYRARDKADGVDREGLQGADQGIRFRKVKLRENKPGHGAVEKEVIPLDRGPDRAGDYRPPQLHPVLDLGKHGARFSRRRHRPSKTRLHVIRLPQAKQCPGRPIRHRRSHRASAPLNN